MSQTTQQIDKMPGSAYGSTFTGELEVGDRVYNGEFTEWTCCLDGRGYYIDSCTSKLSGTIIVHGTIKEVKRENLLPFGLRPISAVQLHAYVNDNSNDDTWEEIDSVWQKHKFK